MSTRSTKFTLRFMLAFAVALFGANAFAATAINQVVDQAKLEGDVGTTTVPFQVVLDSPVPLGQTLTVHYHTSDGTAVQPADYVQQPAGSTATYVGDGVSTTVSLTPSGSINGDGTPENHEVYTITLEDANVNLTPITLNDTLGVVTILNDDFTLTFNNPAPQSETVTPYNFGFSIDFPVGETIQFNVSSTPGTATTPEDYTPPAALVTLTAGQVNGQIPVTLINDNIYENNETFVVSITGVIHTSGVVTPAFPLNATGTITSDEAPPVLTVTTAPFSDPETEADHTVGAVITLDKPTEVAGSFHYSTVDGTANGGSDFNTVTDQNVPLPTDGVTTAVVVMVTIKGDATPENHETFDITIASPPNTAPVNATLGATQSTTVTIQNDDAQLAIATDAPSSVVEGGSHTFTITNNFPSIHNVTFDFLTTDGTAQSTGGGRRDFTAVTATPYTILANTSTVQTSAVLTNDDDVFDSAANETYSGNIQNAASVGGGTAVISGGSSSATIQDNESAPQLSIVRTSAATLPEDSATPATFAISSDKPADSNFSVTYTANDGTANVVTDFNASTGTLTFLGFPTFQTTQPPVNVTFVNDATPEATENFTVDLSGPTGSPANPTILTGSATQNIANEDVDLIVTNGGVVNEGTDSVFTITIAGGPTITSFYNVTFLFNTTDGTAQTVACPFDYTAQVNTPGSITAGTKSTTINVPTNADGVDEGGSTEDFSGAIGTLAQTGSVAATTTSSVNSATGTIQDVSGPPTTVTISNSTVDEAAGTATFVVSASGPTAYSITVNYSTADGTAKAPGDYASATGATVTIPATCGPAPASANITVPIVNNTATWEPTETFTVTVNSATLNSPAPVGLVVNGSPATGTITDNNTQPTFTIAPSTAAENAGPMVFNVNLATGDPADDPITVTYSTADGPGSPAAVAGSDYTSATNATATIPGAASSTTISVPLIDNALWEVSEKFHLLINAAQTTAATTPPTLISVDDTNAVGTITDNETQPTFTVANASLAENGGTMNFGVTLASGDPAEEAINITYSTTDGSAQSGGAAPFNDFNAVIGGTVTIPSAGTTANLPVVINDDAFWEGTQTFTASGISAATQISATNIGINPTATGTITDDETPPTIAISDASPASQTEGAGNLVYTIQLTGSTPEAPTTVPFTLGGTATPPPGPNADYTVSASPATIPGQSLSTTVTVTPVTDANWEVNETVTVTITDPITNGGATLTDTDSSGTGTILDANSPPELIVSDGSSAEGSSGSPGSIQFTVTLRDPVSLLPATAAYDTYVTYTTTPGTAIAGSDYVTASGAGATSLKIPAGSSSANVVVNLIGDNIWEDQENFTFDIGPAHFDTDGNTFTGPGTPTVIADNQGIGTITDDDAPTISITPASAAEGAALSFNVSISNPSSGAVDVAYSLAGSGIHPASGGDFTDPGAGHVTIPGDSSTTTTTIVVNAVNDIIWEPTETFDTTITSATTTFAFNIAATNTPQSATGTITDNDTPTITIAPAASNTEGAPVSFLVTSTNPSQEQINVHYSLLGVTATLGTDFSDAAAGTVTIPGDSSSTTTNVVVNTANDNIWEANETFTATLTGADTTPSNLIGIIGGANTGTGTINDNDTPTVTIDNPSGTEPGTVVFTVSLSNPSDSPVTINYTLTPGTASVADYTDGSGGSVTIPGDSTSTSTTITVNVTQDNIWEPDETFTADLAAGSVTSAHGTANGTPTSGTGTILANDQPFVITDPTSVIEGTGGGSTVMNIPVHLVASDGTTPITVSSNATVNYSFSPTGGFAATLGTDYADANAGSVTILTGNSSTNIVVNVSRDNVWEHDETFLATVNSVTMGLQSADVTNPPASPAATQTIQDDDPVTVTLTGGGGTTEGATPALTINLSNPSSEPITVSYTTNNVAPTTNADYTDNTNSPVVIPALSTSAPINFSITDDPTWEPAEGFTTGITTATTPTLGNATVGGTAQTLTIAESDVATFTVNPGTGNEGPGHTVDFQVSLSNAAQDNVTATFTSTDGTANAATDFFAPGVPPTPATFVFTPGVITGTYSVTLKDDNLCESFTPETFTLNATNVQAQWGTQSANVPPTQSVTGTIFDDDCITTSIDDIVVSRGGDASFTVSLNTSTTASLGPVKVDYTITNWCNPSDPGCTDNAIQGTDYDNSAMPFTGTLTFNTGELTKNVVVHTLTTHSGTVKFAVNLSNPQKVTIVDSQGIGTIIDAPALPTVTISGPGTVSEDVGTVTYTVTLSQASGQTVTVHYSTGASGDTATAGTDYTPSSGIVTFAPGVTSQTFSVPVIDDDVDEDVEWYTVNLTGATNATIAIGTLVQNIDGSLDAFPDTPSVINIDNPSVIEGTGGSSTMVFQVTLSKASGKQVSVDYATAAGTAVGGGTDYANTSGTLVFQPGETIKTIPVPITTDALIEGNETFTVGLSAEVNATLFGGGPSLNGTGTIVDDDGPIVVSIAATNSPQTEGSALTFDVTLSTASTQTVTVNYSTVDGTAIGGSDYTGKSGTLVFTPGTTTLPVSVSTTDDNINEAAETLSVALSSPTNAILSPTNASASATINDNDPAPTVDINDVTVTEGDSGVTNAIFTVTLSAASGNTVSVPYATADGSAKTSDEDYGATSGTLVFAPGTTTQTITVPVNGDTTYENGGTAETFTVNLGTAVNGTVGDGSGLGTITNDDNQPTISINNVTTTEGNSGTTPMIFTVSLTNPTDVPFTANYSAGGGTATGGGTDYTLASGTLTFAAGDTSKTITASIVGDTIQEGDETFVVTVNGQSPAGTVTPATITGTGTIKDDEDPAEISIDSSGAIDEGNGPINFVVHLNHTVNAPVTFTYQTTGISAVNGTDYVGVGPLTGTIPANTLSITIPVTLIDDNIDEPTETFEMRLSNPSANAVIVGSLAVGTIRDDDAAPVITLGAAPAFTEANTGTTNLTFNVTLDHASASALSVDYATSGGTATAGVDYIATSGTLTFSPGDTTATINVPVIGDTMDEPNETFLMTLSNPVNATIAGGGTNPRTATITDNDPAPTVVISNASVTESDTGSNTMSFTVTLSNPTQTAFNLTVNTAPGTATAGVDYTSIAGGTLSFASGQTTATVNVTVLGDTINEPNETFTVTLSGAAIGTTLAGAGNTLTATGTILDDDEAPAVLINNVSTNEPASGTATATFAVTLSHASSQTITVDYTTVNDSALSGSDYVAATGTLTFAAGSTTPNTPLTVTINSDGLDENDETYFVTLSNPTGGAVIGNSQGVGTIVDQDTPPSISVSSPSVAEGNSGTSTVTFNVTLGAASAKTITAHYATGGGTATAGSDYEAAVGDLVFAPGVTSQTVDVIVNGDTIYENGGTAETFDLSISSATNTSNATATGTATITDTDAKPTLSVSNPRVVEGNGPSTPMVFTISLSNPTDQAVTFDYTTNDGTAAQPSDYTTATGTGITIPAGSTSTTVTVTVKGDSIQEADETLTLDLTNITNTSNATAQGTGTIQDDDQATTLAIADVSMNEGNAAGTATLSVTVHTGTGAPTSNAITVAYSTANGTATAGTDYTTTSNTLTIPSGTADGAAVTFTVPVLGDTVYENDETFTVTIANAVGATIDRATATVTLVNDDAAPTIAISGPGAAVTEGNNAVFTVTLTNATDIPVSYTYATVAGSATEGFDYTGQTGTLTFPGGTASGATQTITIATIDDSQNEPSESFSVQLSGISVGSITTASASATIADNDGVTATIANASTSEGDTGTKPLVFTVTLNTPSATPITIDYATADGPAGEAVAGEDYAAASGTLSFAPGETSKTITVLINGDTKFEDDETFTVTLSNQTAGVTLAGSPATGTITNDDSIPTLTVSSPTVVEGNSGTTTMNFVVSLSNATDQAVTFDYTTTNGTATQPSDYTTASAVGATIAAGSTSFNVAVTINGDTTQESNETLTLDVSNATNTSNATAQGTGTIQDDDTVPQIEISNVTVTEGGTATFTVTLDHPSQSTITVDYATVDGTAVAGSDYTSATGTVTFNPGVTSQQFNVNTSDDTITEPTETFLVNLTNASNASIANSQGIGTITDNDAAPTLSISSPTQAEGNTGTSAMTFTVSLSNPSAFAVSVDYATVAGTATAADGDYVATSGTLTIPAGSTSGTINVTINGDNKHEANETFTVALSNPINASGTPSGTGTITNDDAIPTLTVSNPTVVEGNSGTTTMNFVVSLSNPTDQAVTFDYTTNNGTATQPSDYTTASAVGATIAAGSTSFNVAVTINGDTTQESNETLTLDVSNATNTSNATAQGTGTIQDDDTVPQIEISNVTVTEGGTATFTVTLDHPSQSTITVDYATVDGTAVAGSDYTSATGTVTFNPGVTSQQFNVTTSDDNITEPAENFFVNLTNATNASIANSQGIGTINDNDAAPTATISATSTVLEGDTGTAQTTLTVTLSNPSASTVTVDYATANGTALSGIDYEQKNGTLVFAPGVTTQTITVKAIGDLIDEADETFTVTISNPTNATLGLTTVGTVTITDDDAAPSISINDVTVVEGNSGTTNAVFTVTLSNPSSTTITVDYATSDGSATTADNDYVAIATSTLSFAPGETSKAVSVTVNGDTRKEGDETFNVDLSNASVNASIGDNLGVGTIQDDDTVPQIEISNVTVTEGGTATFTVTLDHPSQSTITVDYATVDGTAVAGSDYTSATGTVTFNPGVTSQQFNVNTSDDNITEPTETFFVNLTNATNASIANSQGIGTINDNDAAPTLSISSPSTTEGDSGTKSLSFSVSLSNPSAFAVQVDYATGDATATAADGDYVATSGTLTIPAGSTSGTINVTINGDTKFETNETFSVTLSNPVNATGTPTGTGTITNDDAAPQIDISNASLTEPDSGSAMMTFTVTLSNPTQTTFDLAYTTAPGTAGANVDYTTTAGTINFAAGQTTATILVPIIGDTAPETNETFQVQLSDLTNAAVPALIPVMNNDIGTGTIIDNDSVPTVSVAPAQATEGNNVIFNITLSNPISTNVTVTYATSDGSATTADSDYTSTSGTATITAGTTSTTVSVPTGVDSIYENNEHFTFTLTAVTSSDPITSNPNAKLGTAVADGTIVNDDAVPTVTVSSGAQNEDAGPFTVTLTLTGATEVPIPIDYATQNGTAIAGSDYTATSGTIVFPPSLAASQTSSFNVPVSSDNIVEPDETFIVVATNPISGDSAQGVETITNDDATTVAIGATTSALEGNSGTTPMVFTVTLTNPASTPVKVDYATSNGSASAPSDYTASSGVLTFAPGETTKTITVLVNGDDIDEGTETFTMAISNPSPNAILGNATSTATIVNDDPPPFIGISDVTVVEGNSGPTSAVFTVTLTNPSKTTITVDYTTNDGSATTLDGDYNLATGTVSFGPGETSKNIVVTVNGDTRKEGDETFTVDLSNATGGAAAPALINDNQGVGTIQDDDTVPAISIDNVTVAEGGIATFTVSLDHTSSQNVSVDYATTDGTAVGGSDYATTTGTVVINAGTLTQTFTVQTTDDNVSEPTETFFVTLSNPGSATIANTQGIGTITDNDGIPTVSFTSGASSVAEGNSGTTVHQLTLNLSNPSADTITVNYATSNGSAIAGLDYTAASGRVTFAPGVTTQTINLSITGDLIDETDETFDVTLATPANATICCNPAVTVTITNDDAPPAVSINDVTVVEGNNGTTNAVFTVTLSNPSSSTVTVDYATSDGSATTADNDYTGVNATPITFNPGETAKSISIAVIGDTRKELDETFNVDLSNVTGGASGSATIADNQGVGTIQDDDTVPAISIDNVTVTEGGTATFTVSLDHPSQQTITVNYATVDATADSNDYTGTSGTLTFNPGVTTQQFNVSTTDDNVSEATETFFVNLTAPTNATIANTQGIGTILDNDAAPVVQFTATTASASEGNSGTTPVTLTVTLNHPSSSAVTVSYATADGTAVAGLDYTQGGGVITFAPGATSQTVVVNINGDNIDEADETFTVNLSAPSGATLGANATNTVTIQNDDSPPAISISDATVVEGNNGTTSAVFTVTLSNPSSSTVTVDYATSDGSATTADNDYVQANPTTLSFNPGSTSKTISITVNGDTKKEGDETFNVDLSNVTGGASGPATIIDNQGVGTIQDDDTVPAISIDNVTVTEGGTATFTVSLDHPSQQTITVNYATVDATANSSDYTAASGTLTFNPGVTTQQFNVSTTDDNVSETTETFFVNLTAPTNATIANTQGIGTILDNDGTPTVQFASTTSSVAEGNAGSSPVTLTLNLSNPSASTITVNYATANGTAIAGLDYTAASGRVTFAPGVTSQVIILNATGDTIFEGNETFTVLLSTPANASLGGNATNTVTIIDDDGMPSISIANTSVSEGDTGTTNAVFNVTLTNPSASAITVDYTTNAGSAAAGTDYTTTTGTVTFPAGTTTQTISVPVVGDTEPELNETFTVVLSNPSGASIGSGTATGTIIDNDSKPTLTVNDLTVNEGVGTAQVTVTLSIPISVPVSVAYSFGAAGDTATGGTDYNNTGGTVNFAANQTTATISVPITDDNVSELTEFFTVNLGAITGPAQIAKGTATVTIVDNEQVPVITIADSSLAENGGSMLFTVSLSVASDRIVAFDVSTADGTATNSVDYTPVSQHVQIGVGLTTTQISVPILDDNFKENNETFFVNLTNPINGAIGDAQATGTIIDNDALPTLSIDDVSANEGDSGAKAFTFTVTLSAASNAIVAVDYATAGVTATVADSDYSATNGTLLFLPGITTQKVTVLVNGDTRLEPNETFTVNLTNASNATIADNQGLGTIINDDGVPRIIMNDAAAPENAGSVVFNVLLNAASSTAITVNYATSDSTATTGSGDYTAVSGMLTFNPGETAKQITVPVQSDATYEADETFTMTLSAPVGASIAQGVAIGTILNDDPLPVLSIDSPSFNEGQSGTSVHNFTITLAPASGMTTTVTFATSNGTATAGSDYNSVPAVTLVFVPGETVKTVPVTIIGDKTPEPNETILGNLSFPLNATISATPGTMTLVNDDFVTSTALTSNINPSTYNQTVTFTATVTTVGVPTGSIDFIDGETVLATVPLTGTQAQYTTSALVGGLHQMFAKYSGDSNYLPSTSPEYDQTVNPAPTSTTVNGTPNPAHGGVLVTITATVTNATPFFATGTVTFADGANPIGTVGLVNGTASMTTSTLAFGNHTIHATYSGDSNFATSTNQYNQNIDSVIGSLDGNSTVDSSDLLILANYLAGNVAPGVPPFTSPLAAADLNSDGLVNAVDYQILSQYLVGNITSLPCLTCH